MPLDLAETLESIAGRPHAYTAREPTMQNNPDEPDIREILTILAQ